MLELKNTVTEMNAFNELSSRLNMAQDIIHELENILIETSGQKWNRISKKYGTTSKGVTY